MDDDLETGFYVAAGTAAAAGAGIAAVTYGPALMAASVDVTLPTLAWVPGGMTIGQGGMLVATGGGLAVGTTTVTVTGAQTAAAAGLLGGFVFMSGYRSSNNFQKMGNGDNTSANQDFKNIVNQLKLSQKQARELHDEISQQGYSIQEILEIAKSMFGK